MKYRVTEAGFVGWLVKPGDTLEWEGPPPISGLVPIEDEPTEQPDEPTEQAAPTKRGKREKAPAQAPDEADPI